MPEIGALAAEAGLRVVAFLEPVRYEPATYMSDPVIARMASALPLLERAAFAERLSGNLRTHVFYATRAGFDTVARPEDTQAIPVLREMDAQKLAAGLQPGSPLVASASTASHGARNCRRWRRASSPRSTAESRWPRSTQRSAPRAACRAGRISTPSSRTSISS